MQQVLTQAPTNSDMLMTLRHLGSAGTQRKTVLFHLENSCSTVIFLLKVHSFSRVKANYLFIKMHMKQRKTMSIKMFTACNKSNKIIIIPILVNDNLMIMRMHSSKNHRRLGGCVPVPLRAHARLIWLELRTFANSVAVHTIKKQVL